MHRWICWRVVDASSRWARPTCAIPNSSQSATRGRATSPSTSPKQGRNGCGKSSLRSLSLFERGALRPLPVRTWDIRNAPAAFRYLREGHNVGKLVLTIPRAADTAGTVLITGGTGALGSLVARHLASKHGVRHLLLASRRGTTAPCAQELQDELSMLGCQAEIVTCDVGDRKQLEKLLSSIPDERPLRGVIHMAGVLNDGVIETLDAEQVERVMRPKVDGATHLHEAHERPRARSVRAVLIGRGHARHPGAGQLAAANAFLDALAHWRRARGLRAQSLAWGLWLQAEGVGIGGLEDVDRTRLSRIGIDALSPSQGLELLDAAQVIDEPFLVPVQLNLSVLHAHARNGLLPPLLERLVRAPVQRKVVMTGSLAVRMSAAPEGERDAIVLEAVCGVAAVVLGHESADAIDPEIPFKDLGFDSLAAVRSTTCARPRDCSCPRLWASAIRLPWQLPATCGRGWKARPNPSPQSKASVARGRKR